MDIVNPINPKDDIELYQTEITNLRQYKFVLLNRIQENANRVKLLRDPDSLNQYIDSVDETIECFDKRLSKTESAFFNIYKMVTNTQVKHEAVKESPAVINDNERTSINRSSANTMSHHDSHISIRSLMDKLKKFLLTHQIRKRQFVRKLFGNNINTDALCIYLFFQDKDKIWDRMTNTGRERYMKIRNFLNNPNEIKKFLNEVKADETQHRYRRSESSDTPRRKSPRLHSYQYNMETTSDDGDNDEDEDEIVNRKEIKIKIQKSRSNQFGLPKHKEYVLRKYFSFNRYPDKKYSTNYPFHPQKENGFDYLAELLDLDRDLVQKWFEWKNKTNPLTTYHNYYEQMFRLFLTGSGDNEVHLFARQINEPVTSIKIWLFSKKFQDKDLNNAIKFYRKKYIDSDRGKNDSLLMDDECVSEDIHIIYDEDVESIDSILSMNKGSVASNSGGSTIVLDDDDDDGK